MADADTQQETWMDWLKKWWWVIVLVIVILAGGSYAAYRYGLFGRSAGSIPSYQGEGFYIGEQ